MRIVLFLTGVLEIVNSFAFEIVLKRFVSMETSEMTLTSGDWRASKMLKLSGVRSMF